MTQGEVERRGSFPWVSHPLLTNHMTQSGSIDTLFAGLSEEYAVVHCNGREDTTSSSCLAAKSSSVMH